MAEGAAGQALKAARDRAECAEVRRRIAQQAAEFHCDRADRAVASLREARADFARIGFYCEDFDEGNKPHCGRCDGCISYQAMRRIDAALAELGLGTFNATPSASSQTAPDAPDLRALLREALEILQDVHEGTCPQHWANVHVAQVAKKVQPADCACGVEAWRNRARAALDAGELPEASRG